MPRRQLKPSQLPPVRDALTRALMRAIAPVFAPLVGSPMTRAHVRVVAQATIAEVVKSRNAFVALAVQQYRSMDNTGNIDPPPLRNYTVASWEMALRRAWSTVVRDQTPLAQNDVARALVTADHQGREAERAQLVAYSMHDDKIVGWARVDFSPPTCPFCTMLISRGPVYSTAESAGRDPTDGRNRFHHGDTCGVILVTKETRDSYPGIERTRAAERAWITAGKGTKSGAETLDNLRKTHAADQAAARAGKTGAEADTLTEQQK